MKDVLYETNQLIEFEIDVMVWKKNYDSEIEELKKKKWIKYWINEKQCKEIFTSEIFLDPLKHATKSYLMMICLIGIYSQFNNNS